MASDPRQLILDSPFVKLVRFKRVSAFPNAVLFLHAVKLITKLVKPVLREYLLLIPNRLFFNEIPMMLHGHLDIFKSIFVLTYDLLHIVLWGHLVLVEYPNCKSILILL